ncbi:hypothetical protein DFH07DRAFT_770581 [Mycena maculata]|uniref:Uncharacterized protein n=1 Tax=Mycena maculata TaxID=230809 RepID=A0AAD7JGC3_9AGAR|nr:hypothetical protein DFH07DRAFT_770581 [Mycena maculata]
MASVSHTPVKCHEPTVVALARSVDICLPQRVDTCRQPSATSVYLSLPGYTDPLVYGSLFIQPDYVYLSLPRSQGRHRHNFAYWGQIGATSHLEACDIRAEILDRQLQFALEVEVVGLGSLFWFKSITWWNALGKSNFSVGVMFIFRPNNLKLTESVSQPKTEFEKPNRIQMFNDAIMLSNT